jgi:hypothetical protein
VLARDAEPAGVTSVHSQSLRRGVAGTTPHQSRGARKKGGEGEGGREGGEPPRCDLRLMHGAHRGAWRKEGTMGGFLFYISPPARPLSPH